MKMSVIKEEVNFQRCLEAGDMPRRGPAVKQQGQAGGGGSEEDVHKSPYCGFPGKEQPGQAEQG